MSADGRRVFNLPPSQETSSAVAPVDRSHLKRQSTGSIDPTVHRVSVDFNLVRREGEMDDDREYLCPHCGCRVRGSLLMRVHLIANHAQLRR